MTTHTPGPWTVWGDDSHDSDIPFIEVGRGNIPSPECKSVCDVRCTVTDDEDITAAFVLTDEDRANAALIASAPDLLEALEELIEVADLRGDADLPHPEDDTILWTARMQTAWDEAHAAIEKANGDT